MKAFMSTKTNSLLAQLDNMTPAQLRRLLVEQLTQKKLGLNWESNAIERDEALNADIVLPRLVLEECHSLDSPDANGNIIIEGDNFDSLRLLRATHRGKIRVIYIDPPYNTGNKDWVYNDHFVGANDRYRHSQWLEFLYRRLTLARDLLTPDGVILVSINDENRSRLELLMEQVFPRRRLGSLVWRTKDTGNDLSQRFSHVHEHILVYANSRFKFNGRKTDRSKFRNVDNDARGDWSPQPMTSNKSLSERANTYYPIQNPDTGYWYPCDPNSVWRFASEKEIRKRYANNEIAVQAALGALRSDTIETLIAKRHVYFPPCAEKDVMYFEDKDALLKAIREGKGPILPKKKTPLLREDLPDLEFWIAKPIATGRPSRKEFWDAKSEEERIAPLSSWIGGVNETLDPLLDHDDLMEPIALRSPRGGIATDEIKMWLGAKVFQHPKPVELIKNLLSQATRPGDIVLDFFAGSGTTAQAVLALNAEDGGARKFILCSSTEATSKEPNKNLCRDICAKRLRRVIERYGTKGFLPGGFAYLQMDKMDSADVPFESSLSHAAQLLSLRYRQRAMINTGDSSILQIASDGELAVLLASHINDETLQKLAEWPARRLAVYSSRPESVADHLARNGKSANSYSLLDALLRGQTTHRVS
ncbi:site-specific DNA-methyltransferase [Pseudomonas brassicacearum]|uniref:site-specific DNA-methyltransferase (adenine-specific) n=1 Tax=Pseudomonas brassicacearum subsp. neoaurantiaca TaxID=494916 RepID=A0A7V8UEB2_9PSED|nr:site-specific DNA-methyltransferase [Pseudomonas brassicacearum]MBA1379987.1 site-specific DNA-methyltransferase [Pseudomonas brassicacearum subsp. neoaurantiaca]